jgi:hypothetical protein
MEKPYCEDEYKNIFTLKEVLPAAGKRKNHYSRQEVSAAFEEDAFKARSLLQGRQTLDSPYL